jgi:hypothetical protein
VEQRKKPPGNRRLFPKERRKERKRKNCMKTGLCPGICPDPIRAGKKEKRKKKRGGRLPLAASYSSRAEGTSGDESVDEM